MVNLLIQAALIGLAGYRLAALLGEDAGPGDVLERGRRLLGVPAKGAVTGILPTLLTCLRCLTIWTVLAMWALWQLSPEAVAVIAAMAVTLGVVKWMD